MWWFVAALLVAVAVLDRWLARREPRPRERPARRPGGGGSGAFGELIAGFQPNVRHLHEEQERQRHDLVLPGDADRPWDVDLEAGTVRVPSVVPAPDPAEAAASPDGEPGRRLTEVAPGVWTTTARRWATVSTVVVADDGVSCLVVDPGITVDEVEGLAAELRRRGWRPVAGFSTHPHWDHVLWCAALGDAPRWATAGAVARSQAGLADIVQAADAETPGHDHTLTARLTALPEGARTLPWDGPLAVVLPYEGHCPGSAALLLPHVRVLLAGDMLSDVEIPLLHAQAPDPVREYSTSLDVLERASEAVDVLVPGHGTVGDAAEVRRRLIADRHYLAALLSRGPVTDERLDDPEQAAQHVEQERLLRA